MKELDPFTIDKNTKPSFETDVAKWYLLKKGNRYACWRWDSKKNDEKAFIITDLDGNLLRDEHSLGNAMFLFGILETTEGK